LLFWNATKAYNPTNLRDVIEALRQTSSKAAKDFKYQNPRLFYKAFKREDSKYDVIINMSQIFNAYVVYIRNKHLINMLEDIRMALMERNVVKRAIM